MAVAASCSDPDCPWRGFHSPEAVEHAALISQAEIDRLTAEVQRLRGVIRQTHEIAATVGGGPCVCGICASDD